MNIPPMTPDRRAPAGDQELLDRIRAFIAEATDKPFEAVELDSNIYTELGADSLGGACIFIDISYEFGIPEPADTSVYVELDTARKIFSWVRQQEAGHA